jgi:diguanylate cyclase (GGDEF)-like protein
MKNKTILVVDDTISNLDIVTNLLQDYDLIDATSGKDALEIVAEEKIDLILLDIMMPDMDGYEVCNILKADEKTENIPIVFITAVTDEESIEKAYDLGGADYVTKPFKPKELLSRVKKELKIQDLIHDLEEQKKELKLLASTDSMTKLYNRRYFTKISEHTFDLVKREQKKLSIMMIDIDRFKSINDTYGHQIGDEVIISLANILLKNQRKSDIVCRFGGEEFLILLPHTSTDGTNIVAQKIRQDVENVSISNNLHFTVSIGISAVIPEDTDIDMAIARVDKALYKAKTSGRNRVCTFRLNK